MAIERRRLTAPVTLPLIAAAFAVGVDPTELRRLAEQGRIPHERHGGLFRFDVAVLRKVIRRIRKRQGGAR